MKFLIVGLGNIGPEYENTRHNIGFMVLDAWAKAAGAEWKFDRLAYRTEVKHKGRIYVLIKPTTYMNLSGKAVRYWLQEEKLQQDACMVIVDDLALPFGAIRIKAKGSDGGHNGLAHIAQTLGNSDYARLRFGIGSDFSRGKQIDYVLEPFSKDEMAALPERMDKMIGAVQSFGSIGLARTMNFFNGK